MGSRFKEIAEALRLEHTIFALPFAYLGLWVAAYGEPAWSVVLWVTLGMAGARTAGMALNRIIDLPIDRMNPRTRNWPVAAGRVKAPLLSVIAAAAAGLLFLSARMLNPLCFKLAPWALLLMAVYPWIKRITWACHFVLGAVLACAPAAGWIAAAGRWDSTVLPLCMGVLFWVAGFDILYALLDLDFDRANGVYSVPQQFGLQRALATSSLCHILAVAGFVWFGRLIQAGGWYWAGCAVVAGTLIYEHRLVRPASIDRINKAFFAVNGWVSVSLFLFTLLDLRSSL